MKQRLVRLFAVTVILTALVSSLAGCEKEVEVTRVVQETVIEKETIVEKETVVQTVIETVKETVIVAGTPEVQEVTRVVVEEKEVVVTATPVPPSPTPAPAVGGKLTYAVIGEAGTLDVHKAVTAFAGVPLSFMNAALLDLDEEGQAVPWLAESWEISEDGLTWEFKLKQGVKFHNGSPFTAHDYVWTFDRAVDPDTGGTDIVRTLGRLESWEAVDDYTLKLVLTAPYYPFTFELTGLVPLQKDAVETAGEQYGRTAVSGVGPYKFKEWATGERIVLERNPDYNWGPPYAHAGPAYIETIEFRIIPEFSTIMAGLETGEIDFASYYVANITPKDIPRLEATGNFQIFQGLQQGASPFVAIKQDHPPLDDLRVRQALNLAVDRENLLKVAADGLGVVGGTPLSPATIGYWPGSEEIAFGYDLPQAKQLMADAGWTDSDGDGILDKDGEPLELEFVVLPSDVWQRIGETLQFQWKALGVDAQIVTLEPGVLIQKVFSGDYDLCTLGSTASEADVLYWLYHTSNQGGFNFSWLNDAEMDRLLDLSRTETDGAKRQEVLNTIQKRLIDQAVSVFIHFPATYAVVNNRVKGVRFSVVTNSVLLGDAYIETK